MPRTSIAFPTRPSATVLQSDIQTAVANSSSHCMIADALRREYPNATRILVDVRTVRMTDPIRKKRYTWMTPYEAARFLVRWDQGILPPEFHFRLRTPLAITDSGTTGSVSHKAKSVTHDGTVIGGKPTPSGALVGGASRKYHPPKASRSRGFGIHALKEAPENLPEVPANPE